MYQGPFNQENLTCSIKTIVPQNNFKIAIPSISGVLKPGTLLLGDISLLSSDNEEKILNQVSNHFHNYFRNIMFYSLPHHGAKNNWNKKLLDLICKKVFWISTSNMKDSKHPALAVKNDLINSENDLIICNEENKVTIEIK